MSISVQSRLFGKSRRNGKEATLISLSNENGTRIEIISYGAAIRKWIIKDSKGAMKDIVLGYDTLSEYETDKFYLGCVVGRVANRVNGGKFTLDEKEYQLTVNRYPHHLHGGGENALCRKFWNWELLENGVKLSCVSPDGEEGYPGELHVAVTYTLNSEDELHIDYQAKTDKPTIINLTNHSYFNLENEGRGNIKDHVFQFFTDKYLPADTNHLVTGQVCDVHGSRWDFSQAKRMGDICESNFAFDNQMCFDPATYTGIEEKKIARITSPKSGISIEIASNQVGAQFYTGDRVSVDEPTFGKGGKLYAHCAAFALEPQACPDAINKPNFPSNVLRPGDLYHHISRYSVFREMTLYKVRLVTGVATCLSIGTIVMCILVVPSIISEISTAWNDFDAEMQEFRIQSNDLWKQMMLMSTPTTRNAARIARYAEKAGGSCNCNKENKCPPGPPGPPGPAGEIGLDGLDGQPGLPGSDAPSIQRQRQKFDKCFHCPHGTMGLPGPPGKPGPRGMKGAPGPPPMAGRDSPPGSPGNMGPPGLPGPDGHAGPAGPAGKDAEAVKGLKGAKGAPGLRGPAGPKGDNGKGMGVGLPGPPGPPGDAGFQGAAGRAGDDGEVGDAGEPGKDANYCPCPGRSDVIGGKSEQAKVTPVVASYSAAGPVEATSAGQEITEGYAANGIPERSTKLADQPGRGATASAGGNSESVDDDDTGAGGEYSPIERPQPQPQPDLPPKPAPTPAPYPAFTFPSLSGAVPDLVPLSAAQPAGESNPTPNGQPHPPAVSPPLPQGSAPPSGNAGQGAAVPDSGSTWFSSSGGGGVTGSSGLHGSVADPALVLPSAPASNPAPANYPSESGIAIVPAPALAPAPLVQPAPLAAPLPSPVSAAYPAPSVAPAPSIEPPLAPAPASYPPSPPATITNLVGGYRRRRLRH